MGYQAEKNKIERKIKRVKVVCLCVVLVALLFLCVFSAFVPPEVWKYNVGKPHVKKRQEGELRIHFIDVGQGDCILLELPDGKVALIDGGDEKESTATKIIRYLNALKIEVIDYLIVTHADADHFGGLDRVVEYKTVLNAYLPAIKPENAGNKYARLYEQLLEERCVIEYASRNISLSNSTGETPYVFTFLYPYTAKIEDENLKEDDNASSSVLWLDYHGVSALFTGDASTSAELALVRDDQMGMFEPYGVDLTSTEILKVAHHGSSNSSHLDFLTYLNVQTAVISCGKDNTYGHPSEGVQLNLDKVGATTYRTDENGSVMATISPTGEYSFTSKK